MFRLRMSYKLSSVNHILREKSYFWFVDRTRVNYKQFEGQLEALFDAGMTAYRTHHQKALVQQAVEKTYLTADNIKVISYVWFDEGDGDR